MNQHRRMMQMLFYVFVGLAVVCQTLIFYLNQSIIAAGPRLLTFSILSDTGIILGICVTLLWRWRWCALVLLFVDLVLLITNGLYIQSFNDFFPLSLFAAYKNIDSTLGDFIMRSLRWWLLVMSVPFLSVLIFYVEKRKLIEDNCLSQKTRLTISLVAVSLFVMGQGYVLSYHIQEDGVKAAVSPRVLKEYLAAEHSLHSEVAKWGIVSTYISSLMPWYNHLEFCEDDWLAVDWFVDEPKGELPEKFSEIFDENGGKRLILIIVESFSSLTIGKEVNGEKITPFIDSILVSKDVVFFPNLISQVKGGVSSDAQLMYNTGIYPLSKGASVMTSRLPLLPSLASAFKRDGVAVELVGESSSLWNHKKTSVAWGYDTLYHSLAVGKSGGYFPMADHYIFEKAKEVVESDKKLRMLTICTLSMHGLFSESDLGRFDPYLTGETIDMCAYWEMTRRFDDELRGFVDFLKEKRLYDSSVIAIVGDHNPHVMADSDYTPVPFLILNSGVSFASSVIAGQVDVYPTILDVMGLYGEKTVWPGVGHSLFRDRKGIVGYTRGGKWCVSGKKDSIEVARIREGHDLSEKIQSGISGDFSTMFVNHRHTRSKR